MRELLCSGLVLVPFLSEASTHLIFVGWFNLWTIPPACRVAELIYFLWVSARLETSRLQLSRDEPLAVSGSSHTRLGWALLSTYMTLEDFITKNSWLMLVREEQFLQGFLPFCSFALNRTRSVIPDQNTAFEFQCFSFWQKRAIVAVGSFTNGEDKPAISFLEFLTFTSIWFGEQESS